MRQILNYVGGRFVQGDAGFDDVNPVNGAVIARVHEADAGLVDQAVKSARSALSGPYGRSAATERVRMLRKAADVVERRSVRTLAGAKIKIRVRDGEVRLNRSATVVQADIAASNGTIHAIDRVLLPPRRR